jgi:hypothetical protein
MEESRALFDDWAEHDDASVDDESGFPFTGYRDVLAMTLGAADPRPGQSVPGVGYGTGNLSLPELDTRGRCFGRRTPQQFTFTRPGT